MRYLTLFLHPVRGCGSHSRWARRPLVALLLLLAACAARQGPAHERGKAEDRCRDGVGQACAELAQRDPPEQALPHDERACELGVAGSCQRAARLRVARGELAQAIALERRGCNQGFAPACVDLGGHVAAADPATARAVDGWACDAGELAGCFALALLLDEGSGGPADRPGALGLAGRACDGDEAAACFFVAERALDDGPRAHALLERACRLGEPRGCALAAAGADPRALGASRARLACDAGDPRACYNLALALEQGAGAPADPAAAGDLYERACAEVPVACSNLGRLHERGSGRKADPRAAERWYDRACQGGAAQGCLNTGVMALRRGDAARAREAFARACSLGDPDGCARVKKGR